MEEVNFGLMGKGLEEAIKNYLNALESGVRFSSPDLKRREGIYLMLETLAKEAGINIDDYNRKYHSIMDKRKVKVA